MRVDIRDVRVCLLPAVVEAAPIAERRRDRAVQKRRGLPLEDVDRSVRRQRIDECSGGKSERRRRR